MANTFRKFAIDHAVGGGTTFTLQGADGHRYQFWVDGFFLEDPTSECRAKVIKAWVAADPKAKCRITRMAKKKAPIATIAVPRRYFLTHSGEMRQIDAVFRRVIV
jgi:hypothetical protein